MNAVVFQENDNKLSATFYLSQTAVTPPSPSAHCQHTPPYLPSLLLNIPPTSPTTIPEKL